MKSTKLRWGILGTAQIARKIWQAIQLSGNSTVTAVASRDVARSRKFIAECQAPAPFPQIPRALGKYEDLIAAPDVDAIYLPLPTGIRKEWVLRAAAAGKHVLCEKPCAVTSADLLEMIEACRRNHVQFMDGVMFMHTKRLGRMRAVLDDRKTIGRARRISSAFQFDSDKKFYTTNIRANSQLEPLGCLGDQGWYCIRIALWAMNWELPARVSGRILSQVNPPAGGTPVITEFSGELFFQNGASSDFYCSFVTALEQRVNLIGTKGWLSMNDFVLPFQGNHLAFETGRMEFHFKGTEAYMQPHLKRWLVREPGNSRRGAQEVNMVKNFANQVQSGRLIKFWPEVALKTQQVLEACLESARREEKMVILGKE